MNRPRNTSRTSVVALLTAILLVSIVALGGVGYLLLNVVTDDSVNDRNDIAIPATDGSSMASPSPSAPPTEAQIVQQAVRSVVHVQTDGSQGTGFVYDIRGIDSFVVTNAHVIGEAQQATVIISDGTEHSADVWTRDADVDLAILRIAGLTSVDPLPLGDANQLALGDPIYVIGYALGSELLGDPSLSRGIVSGRRLIGAVDYVQTDAAMNPGNSGGPVINLLGDVIGIATWGIRDANGQPIEGINFAIPIAAVGTVPDAPQLGSGESPVVIPTTGTIPRPQIEPIPTPTLQLTATATTRPSSGQRVVLIDANEFTGGDPGLIRVLPADASMFALVGDAMQVTIPAGDEEYFWAYSSISGEVRDGTVTARIALDGTDSGGVMGRAIIDDNGNLIDAYACLIRSAPNARGFGCYRRENYEWTMLASQDSVAVIPGAWNDVELHIMDGRLEFIVNGQRIFSWSDSDPLGVGRWGAYLRRYDGSVGSSISYDFILIHEYE